MSKKYDVLLCGYYGFGNLGDELLLESLVALLVSSGIARERIAVLSASPDRTHGALGVDAYDRWSLTAMLSALKKSKTLLLGGGGLFQDATSIRSCFYYWAVVRMARMCSVRPWMVGQSLGPLNSPAAKFFARNAVSCCCFRGVRDFRSSKILSDWGLDCEQSPDYVSSLSISGRGTAGSKLLLNIRAGYDSVSDAVIGSSVSYASEQGIEIIYAAMSEEDVAFLKDKISHKILKDRPISLVRTLNDFEELARNSKYAVGMRFHFLLLSYLYGLKVCAGAYDPKVEALCAELSIPKVSGRLVFASADAGLREELSKRVSYSFNRGLAKALKG